MKPLNLNINQAVDEVSPAMPSLTRCHSAGAHHPRHRPVAHQVWLCEGLDSEACPTHSPAHGESNARRHFNDKHFDLRGLAQ